MVLKVYLDFAAFSGLRLNMAKTIIIPLWETTVHQFRRALHDMLPDWSGAAVAMNAAYLGVQVGPLRCQAEWVQAFSKYSKRVRLWSELGLGLQLNARVYNTFAAPVLSYPCQLCDPPAELLAAEAAALSLLYSGPGAWGLQRTCAV